MPGDELQVHAAHVQVHAELSGRLAQARLARHRPAIASRRVADD